MGPGCLLLAKRSGLEMDSQMERPSGLSLGLGEAAAALGSCFSHPRMVSSAYDANSLLLLGPFRALQLDSKAEGRQAETQARRLQIQTS